MPDETKVCKSCFKEKGLTDFYFRKESGGCKNVCKRCQIDGKTLKTSDIKLCKHCGVPKLKSDFQKAGGGKWLQPYCKSCDSIRKKKHTQANKDIIIAKSKKYYIDNKDKISTESKIKRKLAAVGRPNRIFNRMPEEERKKKKSSCDKIYRQKNAEAVKLKKIQYKESGRALETAKAWQAKQRHNVEFVTKKRLRGRIYMALKRGVKSESTMKLLGCSIEFFRNYFQSLFAEGMTWDKYMAGDIVIDHIKPCVKFDLTDAEQQKICFHYSNLQPLWKLDNLKKGTSYNEKHTECQMSQ